MYFDKCKYAEDGKALYRDLVKKYHTDNGVNDDSIIKAINAEFSEWWKTHKNCHYSEEKQEEFFKDTQETAEQFMDIVSKLLNLSGITIEICGTWVWVSGNTYPVKEQLKEFGCQYAKSKKAWFWTAEKVVKHKMRTQSMTNIRMKYGSQIVSGKGRALLEA